MSITYVPIALRRLVYEHAGERCEYCLLPEITVFAAHEIDHIIAEKHGGLTAFDNLALSCTLCNQHKGSDLTSIDPDTDQIVTLYNPRRNRWTDHFQLRGAEIFPLTPTGRATVRLLQFNDPERVEERAWLISFGLFLPPD